MVRIALCACGQQEAGGEREILAGCKHRYRNRLNLPHFPRAIAELNLKRLLYGKHIDDGLLLKANESPHLRLPDSDMGHRNCTETFIQTYQIGASAIGSSIGGCSIQLL